MQNQYSPLDLYSLPDVSFSTFEELCAWLENRNIDLRQADSRKGLEKLFSKIQKGEARIVEVPDAAAGEPSFYRVARTAKFLTWVTRVRQPKNFVDFLALSFQQKRAKFLGIPISENLLYRYPLVELFQLFLHEPISAADLQVTDANQVLEVVEALKSNIRAGQCRDSLELWETMYPLEDPDLAVLRGVAEELNLSDAQVELVKVQNCGTAHVFEEPIDWPGIHSVLEINSFEVVLPPHLFKPVWFELEDENPSAGVEKAPEDIRGRQITVFITGPTNAVLQGLFRKVLQNLTLNI